MRGKDTVNLPQTKISEFYSKWREHCQQIFSPFVWLLKKVHKISLVKKLTVWHLQVELESLHKLTFYLSVLLLMIKMSQSAREKLDSYCKKTNWRQVFIRLSFHRWQISSQHCQSLLRNHSPAARGSTCTLTMPWRNPSSIRGQTHKKLVSIC